MPGRWLTSRRTSCSRSPGAAAVRRDVFLPAGGGALALALRAAAPLPLAAALGLVLRAVAARLRVAVLAFGLGVLAGAVEPLGSGAAAVEASAGVAAGAACFAGRLAVRGLVAPAVRVLGREG